MKIKLLLHTQYMENYSDDPVGNPYWKCKGGDTYTVQEWDADSFSTDDKMVEIYEALVDDFAKTELINNSMAEEYPTGWEIAIS